MVKLRIKIYTSYRMLTLLIRGGYHFMTTEKLPRDGINQQQKIQTINDLQNKKGFRKRRAVNSGVSDRFSID